jgi:hypothetical protein
MSLAIHTKYLGPTDKKQARIKATVRRGISFNCFAVNFSATVNFDWTVGTEVAHRLAAIALLKKHFPESFGSGGMHCCGNTLDNRGFVFTVIPCNFTAPLSDESEKTLTFRAIDTKNNYLIEGDGRQEWFRAETSWQALDMAKASGFNETKGFRVIETRFGDRT